MLGKEAGWYQDPAPPNPDVPDRLRFWDGHAWTGEVKIATKKQRMEWAEQAAANRQVEVRRIREAAALGDPDARQILIAATSTQGTRLTTPDGQQLAGWWRRMFALWIDGIILAILGTIFAWRYVQAFERAISNFMDAAVQAGQRGAPPPDTAPFVSAITGPIIGIAMVGLIVGFIYEVGFLKAFQATPGKMVLGMEVRLREMPGPMPWGALMLRWLLKRGVAIVQILLIGLLIYPVYYMVNYLWPVFDAKKQALHDKAARTNVVRR
jgi:uncharacterized RDD family membrane protein YckC